jgi:putative flippase GtrA
VEQSSIQPVKSSMIVEKDVSLPILKLKKTVSQLIRFSLTGGCNAAIDILVLNLLLWRFPTNNPDIIIVYNTAAYTLGATNSYLLNKYWTFRRRNRVTGSELLRFVMVNVAGILSNDLIFWLAVNLLHPTFANLILLTNASKVCAILGTACISYLGMHLWVFKHASAQTQEPLLKSEEPSLSNQINETLPEASEEPTQKLLPLLDIVEPLAGAQTDESTPEIVLPSDENEDTQKRLAVLKPSAEDEQNQSMLLNQFDEDTQKRLAVLKTSTRNAQNRTMERNELQPPVVIIRKIKQ